jgi:hypothetical protein
VSLLDYDTSHTENWECSQLVEVYDSTAWKNAMAAGGYAQAQISAKKAAVNGHLDNTTCQAWYNSFGQSRYVGNTAATRTIPTANRDTGVIVVTTLATPVNNCQLPAAVVYDPVTNPGGVRCGPWAGWLRCWARRMAAETPRATTPACSTACKPCATAPSRRRNSWC